VRPPGKSTYYAEAICTAEAVCRVGVKRWSWFDALVVVVIGLSIAACLAVPAVVLVQALWLTSAAIAAMIGVLMLFFIGALGGHVLIQPRAGPCAGRGLGFVTAPVGPRATPARLRAEGRPRTPTRCGRAPPDSGAPAGATEETGQPQRSIRI
jgi:hypothetical protein